MNATRERLNDLTRENIALKQTIKELTTEKERDLCERLGPLCQCGERFTHWSHDEKDWGFDHRFKPVAQ